MMVGADLEVETYGLFRPDPGPESDEYCQDLYSIFLSRAVSLRWSWAGSSEHAGGELTAPATRRMLIRAPEWSPASIGWILAALTDAVYGMGFRDRAVIRVVRAA